MTDGRDVGDVETDISRSARSGCVKAYLPETTYVPSPSLAVTSTIGNDRYCQQTYEYQLAHVAPCILLRVIKKHEKMNSTQCECMPRTRKLRSDSEAGNYSLNYFLVSSKAEQSVASMDLSKKSYITVD